MLAGMKQTVVRVVLSSVDIVDIDLLWLSEGRASSGGRNNAELVIRSMCNVMIYLAFLGWIATRWKAANLKAFP